MASGLPVDGIQFIAKDADKFIAALKDVGTTYDKTTNRFRDASGKFVSANDAITQSGSSVAKSADKFMGAIGGVSKGFTLIDGIVLGVGKRIVDFAVNAIGKLVSSVIGAGKALGTLATDAAQLQGVAAGFGNFAAQTEAGADAILSSLQAASAGMVSTGDLMTKFNDAAALVSVQFAERLPEGLEILSKVSAATGTDLNYLLDSFVKGIGRVSPAILDNLKIQVGVAEATAFAAEMFGKEEDALTKVEQQMALTELTLTKLTEKFGGLPDVTQSATANLARIDAMLADIGAQVGSAFLPAWTTMTGAVADAVSWFAGAIRQGGALFPILSKLGAVASIMADNFSQAVHAVIDFVDGVQVSIDTGLSETVDNVLSWGINIATSFAQGIIDGAASALTVAMNFIGGILEGWLKGASPPKVAPDLPQWGISAMTEFLEGFTQADFGILQGIQGPLQKVLEKGAFADISQEIARAISGGQVNERLFSRIAASAGEFGTEIADLARMEFELVASTDALAQAQENLAASGQAVEDAQSQIAALTAEYNQLLRAGATEEQLDAQLALINAAEQQRDAAIEQNAANRDALVTAQAGIDLDRERVENQRDLVDQIISLADATDQQAQAAEDAANAGGGRGGAGATGGVTTPALDAIMPGGLANAFDMTGGLTAAIDNAKSLILEKFGTIFDPIKDIIAEKFGPESAIGKKWAQISDQISAVWNEKLIPFWEDTLKPAIDTALEAFGNMQTFWEESSIPKLAGEAFGVFIDVVTQLAGEIIPWLSEQLLKISEWFVENGPMIDEVIAALVGAWELVAPVFVLSWNVIEPILSSIVDAILGLGTMTLQFVTGDWTGAWETAQTVLAGFASASQQMFVNLILGLTGMLLGEPWASFFSIWTGMWDNMLTTVSIFGIDVLGAIVLIVANITTWIGEQWETFKGWGRDMIRGLAEGIADKTLDVIRSVSEMVSRAIETVKDLFNMHSPSQVMAGLGGDVVAGFVGGIMGGEQAITDAVNSVIGGNTMQLAVSATGAGGGAIQDATPMTREVSVQIGPNYFQSGDAQQLRRMVQQVMRDELRRN